MAKKRKKLIQTNTDPPPLTNTINNSTYQSHTYLNFEDDDEDAINSILEFNSNSLSQLNLNSNNQNSSNFNSSNFNSSTLNSNNTTPASTPVDPGNAYSTLPRLPRARKKQGSKNAKFSSNRSLDRSIRREQNKNEDQGNASSRNQSFDRKQRDDTMRFDELGNVENGIFKRERLKNTRSNEYGSDSFKNERLKNERLKNERLKNECCKNDKYKDHHETTNNKKTHSFNEIHKNERYKNESDKNERFKNERYKNDLFKNERYQNQIYKNERFKVEKDTKNKILKVDHAVYKSDSTRSKSQKPQSHSDDDSNTSSSKIYTSSNSSKFGSDVFLTENYKTHPQTNKQISGKQTSGKQVHRATLRENSHTETRETKNIELTPNNNSGSTSFLRKLEQMFSFRKQNQEHRKQQSLQLLHHRQLGEQEIQRPRDLALSTSNRSDEIGGLEKMLISQEPADNHRARVGKVQKSIQDNSVAVTTKSILQNKLSPHAVDYDDNNLYKTNNEWNKRHDTLKPPKSVLVRGSKQPPDQNNLHGASSVQVGDAPKRGNSNTPNFDFDFKFSNSRDFQDSQISPAKPKTKRITFNEEVEKHTLEKTPSCLSGNITHLMYEDTTPSIAAELWTGANRRILDSNGSIIENDDTSCSAISLEMVEEESGGTEKISGSLVDIEKLFKLDRLPPDLDLPPDIRHFIKRLSEDSGDSKITVSSNLSVSSKISDSKMSGFSSSDLMETNARRGGCNDVVAEKVVDENDEDGGLKGRGKMSSSTSGHSSDISNQNKIYAGSGFGNIQSNVNNNDLQRNDIESVVSGQDAPKVNRLSNENGENKKATFTRGEVPMCELRNCQLSDFDQGTYYGANGEHWKDSGSSGGNWENGMHNASSEHEEIVDGTRRLVLLDGTNFEEHNSDHNFQTKLDEMDHNFDNDDCHMSDKKHSQNSGSNSSPNSGPSSGSNSDHNSDHNSDINSDPNPHHHHHHHHHLSNLELSMHSSHSSDFFTSEASQNSFNYSCNSNESCAVTATGTTSTTSDNVLLYTDENASQMALIENQNKAAHGIDSGSGPTNLPGSGEYCGWLWVKRSYKILEKRQQLINTSDGSTGKPENEGSESTPVIKYSTGGDVYAQRVPSVSPDFARKLHKHRKSVRRRGSSKNDSLGKSRGHSSKSSANNSGTNSTSGRNSSNSSRRLSRNNSDQHFVGKQRRSSNSSNSNCENSRRHSWGGKIKGFRHKWHRWWFGRSVFANLNKRRSKWSKYWVVLNCDEIQLRRRTDDLKPAIRIVLSEAQVLPISTPLKSGLKSAFKLVTTNNSRTKRATYMTATRTEKEARFWREILVKLDAAGLSRFGSRTSVRTKGTHKTGNDRLSLGSSEASKFLNFSNQNKGPTIYDIYNAVQNQKTVDDDAFEDRQRGSYHDTKLFGSELHAKNLENLEYEQSHDKHVDKHVDKLKEDVTETGCMVDSKNCELVALSKSSSKTSSSTRSESLVHASSSTTTTQISFGLSSENSFSRAKLLSEIERNSSTRCEDISEFLAKDPELNQLLIKRAKLRRTLKIKQSEFEEIDDLLQKWRQNSLETSEEEIKTQATKIPVEKCISEGLPTRSSSGNSSDPNRATTPTDTINSNPFPASIRTFNLDHTKHKKLSSSYSNNSSNTNHTSNIDDFNHDYKYDELKTNTTSRLSKKSEGFACNTGNNEFQPYFKQAAKASTISAQI